MLHWLLLIWHCKHGRGGATSTAIAVLWSPREESQLGHQICPKMVILYYFPAWQSADTSWKLGGVEVVSWKVADFWLT